MSQIPFEQSLDRTRPRVLILAPHPHKASTLHYRYTDTGQEVMVPNVWYNQTASGQAATYRWRINLIVEDLDRLARSARLTERVDTAKRNRLLRRKDELEMLAQDHELDAQNDGMAAYSCGNPLPDRTHFARTMQAWRGYLAAKPQHEAAFAAISNMAELQHWEQLCEDALSELRKAFYFDTSDINSRQGANQMQLVNFERLAASLARQQALAAA